MGNPIVVVGGGIAGLTAAWMMRRKFPAVPVIIVERTNQLGGLLTTYDYGRFGRFDCGMHWYTETGISAIDEFFFGLLPAEDWIHLAGARRDLSGLFYRGRLQENSQFPDLRHADSEFQRECLADFFDNLRNPFPCTDSSLRDHARSRFGRVIADRVIEPIATKVHGLPGDQLHQMARFLPLLDRVILFDAELCQEFMRSDLLRSRLAFPEQRDLLLSYSSGRSSYYPRRYGIDLLIKAFATNLRSHGVEICLETEVIRLGRSAGRIHEVAVMANGVRRTLSSVAQLVWTVDPWPLGRLLDLHLPPRPVARRRTVIVSLLLRHPPNMGDLYCFFCGDAPFGTYRVNNFTAVCSEAPRADGFPVSVELFVDIPDAAEKAPDYAAQAIAELLAFRVIDTPDEVTFSRAEILSGGFPSLAVRDIAMIDTVREEIAASQPGNLIRGGILAEPEQFFQHHVLVDLYRKIDCL